MKPCDNCGKDGATVGRSVLISGGRDARLAMVRCWAFCSELCAEEWWLDATTEDLATVGEDVAGVRADDLELDVVAVGYHPERHQRTSVQFSREVIDEESGALRRVPVAALSGDVVERAKFGDPSAMNAWWKDPELTPEQADSALPTSKKKRRGDG